ncbi:MAG: hypothetical protein ACPGQL_01440 [Thermoplasmatota archaeon]
MAQRRKKRTSIRTAAGTAQERYLERQRALAADPTRVYPQLTPGADVPASLAKLRTRLERLAAKGKLGFMDRKDRGVAGAVAAALPLAEMDAAPRLLDGKVAGQRRFYLQRGHVERACSLGVQNHDDPRALLLAYGSMAKDDGLHFFAADQLWCSGATPDPPDQWYAKLAKRGDLTLQQEENGRWGCGHTDRDRVLLTFRGGPGLAVCGACGKRAGHMHKLVAQHYAGPRRRQPVRLAILRADGESLELDDKDAAAYRAGVDTEQNAISKVIAAWRKEARDASDGPRFVLGDQDHGSDQAEFLDALAPEPWERTALAAMTKDGFVRRATTVAEVLATLKDDLSTGVAALLPGDDRFLAEHAGATPRDLLRLAHEEAQHREAVAKLPTPQGIGTAGRWVDELARDACGRPAAEALQQLRRTHVDPALRGHQAAFLAAMGADLAGQADLTEGEREAGRARKELAAAVLAAEGKAYVAALDRYLQESGSGERATS